MNQTRWIPQNTNTHQDHVIAHVFGATILGYLVFDETLYFLLDIGFIWRIYLDGEMGLLPYPMAIRELEVSDDVRRQLSAEADSLMRNDRRGVLVLKQFNPILFDCLIEAVDFFSSQDGRRFVIRATAESLVVETSLTKRTIDVTVTEN